MRVKIEPKWYNGDSEVNLDISSIRIVYTDKVKGQIDSNQKDYWYKDGEYLYYMDSVKSLETPIELVKGIEFLGGNDKNANDYQGKNLKINVTLEMIQCKYAPFKEKWGINNSSNLYTTLDKLCTDANK